MEYYNELTTEQIEARVKDGRITLRNHVRILTTPKKWVIITPERTYDTNNVESTLKKRVLSDLTGSHKVNDLQIISTQKYRQHLNK